MDELDTIILNAHAADDRHALIGLYAQAAELADDIDTKCFFLTYAYVFALELGDPREAALYTALNTHGRV